MSFVSIFEFKCFDLLGRFSKDMMQCGAVRCSVLQCVAVCCSAEDILLLNVLCSVTTETFDVSRSVLLCDAVCCSVLQCVAVQKTFCYSMYHTMSSNYRDLVHVMQCVAV